ncbi:MAG: Holliday junction resolvase RuvX [Patescibacteria group bacterium]
MRILGIDYGQKKIGLAFAEGSLAEPFKVLRVGSDEEALIKLGKVVKEEGVERIVVGISEAQMGGRSRKFGLRLRARLRTPVEFFDETLSTQDARRLSFQSGVSRKKRKQMEDAFAAALMLQSYLDNV